MKNKKYDLLNVVAKLSRKRSHKSIISSFTKHVNKLHDDVHIVFFDKKPTTNKLVFPIGTKKNEMGYFVLTGNTTEIPEAFIEELKSCTILLSTQLENISLRKIEENKKIKTPFIEDHSSLFADMTFEAIFLSEKGLCIDQNETAERIFGYTNEEAIGRPGTDWVITEHRDLVINNIMAGNENPYEVTALRKDGSTFPCEIQGKQIVHQGRQIRVTALRDITNRRKAEQLYNAIKESTNDGFAIIDLKGKVLEVNDTYCRKVGFSREELLKKSIPDMDPTISPRALKKEIKNIIKSGYGKFEAKNMTKDGMLISFEVNATFINEDGGYFIVFLNDISDRTKQENVRKDNEKLLRLITNNFPNSYLSVIEKDMTVSFSAGQEFQKNNLNPDDFNGMTLDDIYGSNSAIIQDYYKRTFKGESCSFELHINNQDQLYNTIPIVNDNGSIERILAFVENISERKQQERVIQCQVRLSELSSTLSLEELLQTYLDEIEDLTQSKIGFFHFVNEDQKSLTLQAWSSKTMNSSCSADSHKEHYPVSEAGVWVDCLYKKETVVHNDYKSIKHKKGMPDGHPDVIREAITPIIRENKILAILGVGNKESDYNDQDVAILNIMADIAWDTVERKKAEEALKENEERFRMLFENMNSGVAIYQPVNDGEDFIFVDLNKFGETHSKVNRDDIVGRSVQEVFPGVKDIGLFDVMQNVYKTGIPEELPLIMYGDDRIKEWVENYVFRLPSGLVVALYDDTSEKQNMINEISRSEERFRTLTENIPGIVYLCENDEKFKMMYLNDEIEKLLGFPKDDFLEDKISFADLIHPDDLANVKQSINASLDNNSPYNLIYRLKNKNGKYLWVEEYGVGIGDEHESGKQLLEGYIHDISERVSTEKIIQESEEKFRTFFGSINDAVFVHPLMKKGFGKLIEVNEIACIRYGYTKEEFLELSPPDFTIDREVKRHSKEDHRKTLLNAGSMVFRTRHVKKSGETFPVEISSNIIELNGNKFVLAVVRDISEREKADEQIRESEKKFRSVIEQSNDAIYILYGNRFDLINKRFTELTGLANEDIESPDFNFMDSVAPESVPLIKEKQMSRKRGNKKTDIYEFEILHKDGSTIPVQASVTEIDYKEDKAILGLLRDITEKKKLELQLIHAQKIESIGHLTGGIAHDFNNLLTPILGNSELAMLDLDPSDPMYESLQEIHETADHAKDLVHQLLAFSRKQILEVKSFDLNKLIADFKAILRRTIREDISIKTHFSRLKGNVQADKSQIEQVLMNLCVNAQDAMPHGGLINIETEYIIVDNTFLETHSGLEKGPHVLLSISDTGEGISEEQMNMIFDPFFTTKELGKGTGLGLATVHGIVKQHNGNILVYSEIGHGTTFKIYLPLVTGKSEIETTKINELKHRDGDETILVVEDKDSVRRMAVRIIKFHGFNVLEASSPEQAIDIVMEKNTKIDLLLTDVIMPGMNGRELHDYILTKQPDIKVIFMSGYTQNVIAHHGVMDEGVNFIQKPFTLETLISKLNKVLGR